MCILVSHRHPRHLSLSPHGLLAPRICSWRKKEKGGLLWLPVLIRTSPLKKRGKRWEIRNGGQIRHKRAKKRTQEKTFSVCALSHNNELRNFGLCVCREKKKVFHIVVFWTDPLWLPLWLIKKKRRRDDNGLENERWHHAQEQQGRRRGKSSNSVDWRGAGGGSKRHAKEFLPPSSLLLHSLDRSTFLYVPCLVRRRGGDRNKNGMKRRRRRRGPQKILFSLRP